MNHYEFDASMIDALTDAVFLGWRVCREYPDLDEPHGVEVSDVLKRAAKARSLEATVLHQAIVLFRGRSNMIGWSEFQLLRALGEAAAGMPGSEKPVMIAAATRVSRMRAEADGHGSGVACPCIAAFRDGARVASDDAGVRALRKLLDRYISVAAVREIIGTARADAFTLADMERLARGPESDVLAAAREDIPIHGKRREGNDQSPERLLTSTFPKLGRMMRPSPARRSRSDG